MQCMVRLISSPPEPGQYDVVNQISAVYRICDLAETVAEVGLEFGLRVRIKRIMNPRVEADYHPMEAVSKKLEGEFGLKPMVRLRDEIRRMFELLLQPEIRERILMKKESLQVRTQWNGEKKEAGVLEEYDPGTKQFKQVFTQQIDRVDGHGKELTGIEEKEEVEPVAVD